MRQKHTAGKVYICRNPKAHVTNVRLLYIETCFYIYKLVSTFINPVLTGDLRVGHYSRITNDFNQVITTKDYDGLLKIYNRKSLVSQATSVLGFKSGELTDLVLRLLRGDKRAELTTAIRKQLGKFNEILA